jgi:hypothetical protein
VKNVVSQRPHPPPDMPLIVYPRFIHAVHGVVGIEREIGVWNDVVLVKTLREPLAKMFFVHRTTSMVTRSNTTSRLLRNTAGPAMSPAGPTRLASGSDGSRVRSPIPGHISAKLSVAAVNVC